MQVNSTAKKGSIELTVELSVEEFQPYVLEGARRIAGEIKVSGFRQGKAPYDLVKAKVGEMTILEEAARVAVNKTIDEALKKGAADQQVVGQPQVDISKLAPGNPLEYRVVLTLLPKTKISKYKDLKIKQEAVKIPEEQINRTLEQLQEANCKKTPSTEAIIMGDLVIADIHISVEKVPVEGGQGKGVNIILGKDYLVPGFDQKLIGAKVGDELKFQINYPADHYQKALAGKPVDFKVNITEVSHRELPALNDEMAKSFGFEKIDELKKNIADSLLVERQRQIDSQSEVQMFEELIKQADIEEIPESLINRETEVMLEELQNNLKQNGGTLEDYLSSINKNREQFILEIMPQAVKRVKTALIINEITRQEKIPATAEEVDHELNHLREHYKNNQEILSRLDSAGYKDYLANAITNNKTIKALKSWNLVASEEKESKTKETKTKETKTKETKAKSAKK